MSSNDDVARFKEWVQRNSGVGTVAPDYEKLSSSPGGLSPSLTALVQAQGQPVVSNGRLVGPNAQQALQADQAVQQARAGGDPQAIQNALAVSPATGCAMILTLAMQASGYNPSAPGAGGNSGGFLSYVQQILLCPAFSAQINDHVTPNMSGDWNSVVNQIAGYYVGIDAGDLNYIRSGLYSLAQAASSSPSTNQTDNLFVQNTMNVGGQLVVYMYQSRVQMVTNVQSGGKHSPDTVTNNASLTLYRDVLLFNAAAWPGYAPVITNQTDASLQDWLNNTTTPQGPVPVKWNN